MHIEIDTRELKQLTALIESLPDNIRHKALTRANRRVGQQATTAVVRMVAKESGMRIKDVRGRMFQRQANADGFHMIMRAGWLSLIALGGAKETSNGVWVRGWGLHRGASLVTFGSGQRGIFKRVGTGRGKLKKLWGPNPVRQLWRGDGREVWDVIVKNKWPARVLHEISFLLRK